MRIQYILRPSVGEGDRISFTPGMRLWVEMLTLSRSRPTPPGRRAYARPARLEAPLVLGVSGSLGAWRNLT